MVDQPVQQAEQQPHFNVNTQSVSIQPLSEFSPDAEVGASLATKWKLWMEDFEMFILASGITDPKRKRALLLYQAGQRVREIFRQLQDTGNESDYDTAKTKLQEYFEPQQNRRYAVYQFRQAKQDTHETLDQFNTRLRSLARTCAFHDVDFEIEQQTIMAGTSSRIRKRALRDPTYDLKAILLDGRRAEQSEFQTREIESKEQKPDGVNKVNTQPKRTTTCRNCGGIYPHETQCPAKGNHFAKVCRGQSKSKSKEIKQGGKHPKKPINPLDKTSDTDSSDEDYVYAVNNQKTPKVKVKVCQHSFKATVDTGSTVNVIDKNTYENMSGVTLEKTSIRAFAYNATKPVQFLGKFQALIETKKRIAVATFYVAKTRNSDCLISVTTAQELGLISLHLNKVSGGRETKLDKILSKHANVFKGLGKLKGEKVKLIINADKHLMHNLNAEFRIIFVKK